MLVSNRIAAFLWGFSLVFMLVVVLFTGIMIRDGAPPDLSTPVTLGIMAAFWLCGLGLTAFAASKPLYFVTLLPGGQVRFTLRYPHKVRSLVTSARELAPPRVVEEVDSEGDAYFAAILDLPDGRVFRLAEGHDRALCEEAATRFVQAIQRDGPQD